MEMGIYAQREYGKTNFKINHASYFFEVVKLDRDEPAEEHEIGRLIFTDLYNHAFPMIRYDTGDLGSYCMNGEGHKEIEHIYGRRIDCIYDCSNSLLSPHSVSNAMWGINNIEQWQFIQQGIGKYKIKIKTKNSIDENDIYNRLFPILGKEALIEIEYVCDIPVLSSQKRKDIINEMKE